MKKSTMELLELLKNTNDYPSYAKDNQSDFSHMRIDRALASLINDKSLKKSEVIARSGLERHYAYQILSGTKSPSRDKVLMLCIGMTLSVEEVQRLLKITGFAPLYARDKRDNVLLFGLMRGMNVIKINSLLYELSLELLV